MQTYKPHDSFYNRTIDVSGHNRDYVLRSKTFKPGLHSENLLHSCLQTEWLTLSLGRGCPIQAMYLVETPTAYLGSSTQFL